MSISSIHSMTVFISFIKNILSRPGSSVPHAYTIPTASPSPCQLALYPKASLSLRFHMKHESKRISHVCRSCWKDFTQLDGVCVSVSDPRDEKKRSALGGVIYIYTYMYVCSKEKQKEKDCVKLGIHLHG